MTLVIGFEGWIWVLIASVPGLCILFTFKILSKDASLVMRKPAYCICENKGTDQLTAKLISVFVVTTQIVLLVHSLVIFSYCTAHFMSDLAGNPEDQFSHNEA